MANQKVLGVFSLAMINVAAIVSLRNLPLAAQYGASSIFFFVLAALVFLIPSALVCAELAAAWPHEGGLYYWVKRAFGKQWGFLAIWAAWMLSIVWFPTILSFCATLLAWAIDPTLAENNLFMIAVMLIMLWGTTFVNFFGMRASSWVSTVGVLLGTIFPCILLGCGAILWWTGGYPTTLELTTDSLLPEMRWSHWVFLAGIVLSFEGMEITAYHVKDTVNPQRQFPKALAIASTLILCISIGGALSVAVILPSQEIDLVAGVVQVFAKVHAILGIENALWITTSLLFLGIISTLNSWVIGPAKGILASYEDGILPDWLSTSNEQGVPIATLLFQGGICSILIILLWWLPSVQSFYWFFTLISAQLTLIMYTLIFLAFIRLRLVEPSYPRPYQVPGRWGAWLVTSVGLIACFCVFGLGFIPPEQMPVTNLFLYETFVIVGLLVAVLPAWIFIRLQK